MEIWFIAASAVTVVGTAIGAIVAVAILEKFGR